jgi:hypothetical protein
MQVEAGGKQDKQQEAFKEGVWVQTDISYAAADWRGVAQAAVSVWERLRQKYVVTTVAYSSQNSSK